LLAVTIYLYRKRKPILYTALPMILVLAATISSMVIGIYKAIADGQWILVAVGGFILFLALWVLLEGVLAVVKMRRGKAGRVAVEAD